jgi:glycosyltransferase involved in cell wall biosynthesis
MKTNVEDVPYVSIIIPCLNEIETISDVLHSLANNDYPKKRMEIIIVDGLSEDGTRDIIKNYTKRYSFIQMLDNPNKITPTALNIGISNSKGDIIIRADAHSSYPNDYVRKCVSCLSTSNADVVGGTLQVVPRKNTFIGKSIALTYSHYFGSGNAYYKIGYKGEIKEVDTVPFGCFKREVFDKIGFFDERLKRSQDIEFFSRLRHSGGKIILVPTIKCYYYICSDLWSYFKHNITDGMWAIIPYRYVKNVISFRHLIPFFIFTISLILFILGLIFNKLFLLLLFFLLFYLTLNIIISIIIANREGNYRLIPCCIISFIARHLGYAIGSFFAFIKVIMVILWGHILQLISLRR